jgi:hypothetical protein
MKRICIHWTAGPYQQTRLDYEHYHYTVGKDGVVANGKFLPEANIPPLVNGRYAQHCGGGNSYTIGIALRGMAGFQSTDKLGSFPLTDTQCEAAWKLVALMAKKYNIPVTPETVYTHYEFGKKHPDSDSAGKIDIIHLPYMKDLAPGQIGDFIRGKVKWYMGRLP